MTLLEQHVGHVMVLRVDHYPLDRADEAVGGVHRIAAAHLHLARRDPVGYQRLLGGAVAVRDVPHPSPAQAGGLLELVVRPLVSLHAGGAPAGVGRRQEVHLLRFIRSQELLDRAAQPDRLTV